MTRMLPTGILQKKRVRLYLLLLFCVALTGRLTAQFQSTEGPVSGGVFDAIYAFNDTAFIDVNANPWRTFDGGQTWEMCTHNLPANPNPDAFVKRGNMIYMATNNHERLYKSTDFGDSWEPFTAGLPRMFGVVSAVPSHLLLSGDRVFLGGTNFGLRYTDLADTSWVEVNTGSGAIISNISKIGEDSLLVTQGSGFTNVTFLSVDNGDTWTQIGSEPNATFTIVANGYGKIGNKWVAVTSAGGVNTTYYSTDEGQSWQLSNNGPAIGNTLIQPRSDLIFAINFEGIYRTTDGVNWTLIDEVAAANGISYWKGNQLLYGTAGFGLFDIPDDGDGVFMEQQIAVATPKDQWATSESLYVLTELGIYTFAGGQWQLHADLIDYVSTVFDPFNVGNFFDVDLLDNRAYLAANTGLYQSDDGGRTFSAVDQFAGERIVLFEKGDQFEILAQAVQPNAFDPAKRVSQLYYYDGGSGTYQQATVDGALETTIFIPEHVLAHNGKLYLTGGGGNSTLYRSDDFGKSWTSLQLTVNIDQMYIFDGKIFFDAYSSPSGRIYSTADDFATYQEIELTGIPQSTPQLNWFYFQDFFVADDRLYLYQNDPGLSPETGNGFYYLSAGSTTWVKVEESILPAPPTFLTSFQGALFAGISSWSVWSDGDVVSNVSTLSEETTPNLVFPNPSSGQFHLPDFKGDHWSVYNLQGKRIDAGKTAIIDLSAWPTGSYWLYYQGRLQQLLKL